METSAHLQKVVANVLDNFLPVKEKDVVTFLAGYENLDLAYAFASGCIVKDAEIKIISEPDCLVDKALKDAPLSYYQQKPKLLEQIIKNSDWLFRMTGSRHNPANFDEANFPKRLMEIEKTRVWSLGASYLIPLCLGSKTNMVVFCDPGLARAKVLGLSYEEAKKRFIESLNINYAELKTLHNRLIKILQSAEQISVSAPNGTNLILSTKDRIWISESSHWPSNIPFPYFWCLPAGEVFVAPIEYSAEGFLVTEDDPNGSFAGLTIEFSGKKRPGFSAKKGLDGFMSALKLATGNPYCLAEFGIGTNPYGLGDKAAGTAHIAIGSNFWFGGKNQCSLHLDFNIKRPTIFADQRCIIENGQFAI